MEEKKKNILIGVLIGIIVILLGVCVYLVLSNNKDFKNQPITNDIQPNDANSFVVRKTLESFYFNVILDTNGNTYLGIKVASDLDSNGTLKNLFNNAKTYSYNNKNEKLIKISLQNIKDIQTINYGNGGGKYIIFLNQSDKLYALLDFDIVDTGDLTPLTDNTLNKVLKVYPECDEGGCIVYADAIIDGKKVKISLHDLFEQYEPVDFDLVRQEVNKYVSPSIEISNGKLPKSFDIKWYSDIDNLKDYKVVLSNDGKVTISKTENEKVNISNIVNAIDIKEGVNEFNLKLFIILNNGDVYEYSMKDFDNKKYIATKINAIKNATKFVTISYGRCSNGCGGDMMLGVIDKNNQYIKLDSFSS